MKIVLLSGVVGAWFSAHTYSGGIQNLSSTLDSQRDPVKLIDALRSSSPGQGYEAAFDLKLTASEVLGPGLLPKLTGKQWQALSRSFERLVAEELRLWRDYVRGPILEIDVKKESASLLVMRGYELVSVKFIARDGVWRIVEVEDLDRDISLFADALRDSLEPSTGRSRLLKMPSGRALKQIETLIATEGEAPSLLLLKAILLGRRDYKRAEQNVKEWDYDDPIRIKGRNQGQELLHRIRSRWPDYAPAHYAYGTEDFVQEKDRAAAVAALTSYSRLRPLDPRGWYWLGYEQSRRRKLDEAESAYREAVRLAPADKWCVEGLFNFYLSQGETVKTLDLLKDAVQLLEDADYLYYLLEGSGALLEEAQLRRLEALLLKNSDRLVKSRSGLRLLADTQVRLGKNEAGLNTMRQVLGLDPQFEDYIRLARINRELRFYEEAVNAAQRAIKLDTHTSFAAYFHLACALAQLDRKQEALDALRRYEEAPMRMIGWDYRGEPDLKPLADMPEFKELTKKYDVQSAAQPVSTPKSRSRVKKPSK